MEMWLLHRNRTTIYTVVLVRTTQIKMGRKQTRIAQQ